MRGASSPFRSRSGPSVLNRVAAILAEAGVENPRRDAELMLEAVTGAGLSGVYLREELEPEEDARLERALASRLRGEPLAYAVGEVCFRGLRLAVGLGVFIPRPETEVTVEVALERLPPGALVADVGTGSGAIAFSLALEGGAMVWATEISPSALGWAERNLASLGLEGRVFLLLGDLFSPLPEGLRGRLDLVVSNPPYVAWEERHLLPREVLFEPEEALFGGARGLAVLERIVREAPGWLRPGGRLVLECDPRQTGTLLRLLGEAGFEGARVVKDLAGRERVVEAVLPETGRDPDALLPSG